MDGNLKLDLAKEEPGMAAFDELTTLGRETPPRLGHEAMPRAPRGIHQA